MKCSGTVKEKDSTGKLVSRFCNEKLSEHDIFCQRCGTPTPALRTDLSAWRNLLDTWRDYRSKKSRFMVTAIFMLVLVYIPIMLAVYFTQGRYWLNNGILLLLVPLALVPFAFSKESYAGGFTILQFIRGLRYYPAYFLFVLVSLLFFLLLKIICTGFLLGLATDPILHLVRLILVLYWLAVIMPVPFLIVRRGMNPLRAIRTAYKAGEETRWQQFYLLLFALLANIAGLVLIVIGLLVSLPFAYYLLERYYQRMEEYELF